MLKNAGPLLRFYEAEVAPRLTAIQRHLRGVKKRVLWVFVGFGLGSSLTWYFQKTVSGWLLDPAHGQLSATGQPIFTSPTDMFSLIARLALVGGAVVAAPVLVFQVVRLLDSLMSRQQRRFVAIFLPAVFVCFLAGTAYAYFVLLPTGLSFLLQFGTDTAIPMIQITEYMDFALAMLFWLGVIFELPLAMFLLARLRLVGYQRVKRFRRYVPYAAIIFSILLTPTIDYVNMALVAVPIVLLFELGAMLAWIVRPRQGGAKSVIKAINRI